MRIIYFAIGVVGIAGPVITAVFSSPLSTKSTFWTMLFAGAAVVVAGILHLVAGIRNYRGHWSFVIGITLLVFAFTGIGFELDDYAAHKSEEIAANLLLIVIVASMGLLSLWSGHKLHRCVIELERRGREPA